MIRPTLIFLLLTSFGFANAQSEQRSMSDMASILVEGLSSNDFDRVSPFLPNSQDVAYYVKVAADIKPEVFEDQANRDRLTDRFREHAELVGREFKIAFDSASAMIVGDSITFPSPLNPATSSYTESGVTEGRIEIHSEGNNPVMMTLVVSLTDRGWTWSSLKVTEVTSREEVKR